MNPAKFLAVMATLTLAQMAHADVKIGFLGTLTGPSADVGRDQLDGFGLALEQLGNKLGGVTVVLIKEDDQQKPELALAGVAKLLDKEKVDIVLGLTFANTLMAIQPRIAATDVPFIGTVAGPSPTAGAQCKPNLFVTSWNSDVPAEAAGKYLSDKGVKRISTLTPNFVGGKDKIAGLKRFYKGEFVDEIYTPLNQLDFSAELTQVSAAKPDAVFAFYPGGLGVTFSRQFQQAGLLKSTPLLSTFIVDATTLPALKESAIGVVSGGFWAPDFPNAASKQFVADFERKYNRIPSNYAAQSYDAAMLLDSAIGKVKGNVADKRAFMAAMKAADFASVRGSFRFNHNNFPIHDMHIMETVRDEAGRFTLKTIATPLKGTVDAYHPQCPLT